MNTARSPYRRLKWAGLIFGVVLLAFYLARVHRWRWTYSKDGWLVQYTSILVACPHCTGRIERLECNGNPIPTPRLKKVDGHLSMFNMATPVGLFAYRYGDRWRIHYHFDERGPFDDDSISPAELDQGWYESNHEWADGSKTPPRKKATPAHWCWGWSTNEHYRWFDPAKLDKLEW